MIKLKDIKVDVASTLGDRFLLTGITPKYVYAEGEKLTRQTAPTTMFSAPTGAICPLGYRFLGNLRFQWKMRQKIQTLDLMGWLFIFTTLTKRWLLP